MARITPADLDALLASLAAQPARGCSVSVLLALGASGDRRAVPALLAALRDCAWPVRWSAARALGACGDLSASPALTAALQDREAAVREAAAEALARVRAGRAAELPREEVAVCVPDLGDVAEGARVVKLRAAAGDEVEAGQALAEIDTDKAVIEVPAPAAGRVLAVFAWEGQPARPGEELAVLALLR